MSELHDHFNTVYVSPQYARKIHLYKNCFYRSEQAVEKPIDAYPRNHIDICSECETRYENWKANRFEQTDSIKCSRCGTQTNNPYHCRDCQLIIERRKAQRRL